MDQNKTPWKQSSGSARKNFGASDYIVRTDFSQKQFRTLKEELDDELKMFQYEQDQLENRFNQLFDQQKNILDTKKQGEPSRIQVIQESLLKNRATENADELREKIEDLRNSQIRLDTQINEKEIKIEIKKEKRKQFDELRQKVVELQSRLDEKNNFQDEYLEQIRQLKVELEKYKLDNQQVLMENAHLKKQLQVETKKFAELDQVNTEFKKQKAQQDEIYQQNQSENDQLKARNQQLEEENQEIAMMFNFWRKKCSELLNRYRKEIKFQRQNYLGIKSQLQEFAQFLQFYSTQTPKPSKPSSAKTKK